MHPATARPIEAATHEVRVTLRFGADTGARQAHEIDPRSGWRGKSTVREVTLHDGREAAAVLDTHGFELLEHARPPVDWNDPDTVVERYYPEVSARVLESTGGTRTFLFDHTVRHGDEAVRKARGVREPAFGVHNDYTHWSARKRLRELMSDERLRRCSNGALPSCRHGGLSAASSRPIPSRSRTLETSTNPT